MQPGMTQGSYNANAFVQHSPVCADEFARPYTDWNDIASKDRLSRRQQVICAANDADGENGRCPDASHSSLQVFNRLDE